MEAFTHKSPWTKHDGTATVWMQHPRTNTLNSTGHTYSNCRLHSNVCRIRKVIATMFSAAMYNSNWFIIALTFDDKVIGVWLSEFDGSSVYCYYLVYMSMKYQVWNVAFIDVRSFHLNKTVIGFSHQKCAFCINKNFFPQSASLIMSDLLAIVMIILPTPSMPNTLSSKLL